MKIVKHYYLEGTLQRSEVRHNGENFVRIARWVFASGALMPLELGPSTPTWRKEPIEEATCLDHGTAQELERVFVATLIRLNEEVGAIEPTYRTLGVGETLMIGDQWTTDGKVWHATVAAGLLVVPGEHYRRAVLSRSPDSAE